MTAQTAASACWIIELWIVFVFTSMNGSEARRNLFAHKLYLSADIFPQLHINHPPEASMEHTLTAKVKQLDELLPVQYRTYSHEVANTPDSSRKDCLVFAYVAVAATSFLKSSVEHTQFTLDNTEMLLEDTCDGHEALKETLGNIEEHQKSAKALHEALGQWMKEEQTRVDVIRADMEDMLEKQRKSVPRLEQPAEDG